MAEILTFGETMVSMTPCDMGPLRYVDRFQKKIAGAESNVAIGATRLGHTARFVTALGDDSLGRYVYRELLGEGVDLTGTVFDPGHRTGVMFKERLGRYETKVWYYREDSAASCLSPSSLTEDLFRDVRLLHVTGVTMALSESCREAVAHAMRLAKSLNIPVSFDPNIRLRLWTKEEAAAAILPVLPMVDIFLPGLDECALLFGEGEIDRYTQAMRGLGIEFAAIKAGKKGCWVMDGDLLRFLDAYPFFDVVDTVGAGDAFASGFLSGVLEGRPIEECGAMANCMGAMATKTADDYQTLPDRRELDVLLQKAPKPADR